MSDDELTINLDMNLSEKEIFFIGKIIAEWGAIEHEIFQQCLLSYAQEDAEIALPKEMNNLSFSKVLGLWKERIVEKQENERRNILSQKYDEITELQDFRNALVHGMWSWDAAEPNIIKTTRVRKKEVITVKFDFDALVDFHKRVAEIHFRVKFLGGLEQLAMARASEGMSFSRRGFELFFGKGDGAADE